MGTLPSRVTTPPPSHIIMALSMRSMRATTSAVGTFGGKKPTPKAAAAASGADFAATLPGAIAPFDEPFLDPLKFSEGADASRLLRYREAELTHGRVAMLATVGFIVGEQVEDSSFLFDKYISGPAIGHFQQVEEVAPLFWETIALFVAVSETLRVQRGWADPYEGEEAYWALKEDYYPGDMKFAPLGLTPLTNEEFEDMQLKELSNGRLAMIAIAGMVAQELVDGKTLVGHFSS